jgi:TolB-like protein
MAASIGDAGEDPPAPAHEAYVDLASQAPLRLGPLRIDPARRLLMHDDGRRQTLERRVMQVLVALLGAGGGILTRDELTRSCWRGLMVGRDALNRVVGQLRHLERDLGSGVFEIQTITKVGYRIISTDRTLPADKPRIAVLPFRNLSGDPDQDRLAEAITQDVLTSLSRRPRLLVTAGGAAGRYLLGGSVLVVGELARVTAQLTDGLSGQAIWAERFDSANNPAARAEIGQAIAAAIELAILRD